MTELETLLAMFARTHTEHDIDRIHYARPGGARLTIVSMMEPDCTFIFDAAGALESTGPGIEDDAKERMVQNRRTSIGIFRSTEATA